MSQTTVRSALTGLAGSSVIYGVGSVLLRGLSFFLLPLYTRFLTPADYGIMGICTTITVVLGLLYPLGLHGAVARFYFIDADEGRRRESIGTLWIAMGLGALAMTVVVDRLGELVTPLIFTGIPFTPYIRIAVWTAFFGTFSLLPLAWLQMRERPVPYVLFTAVSTLLTIGLIIWLVVFEKLGATGYLAGALAANIIMALPYVALMVRQIAFTIRWDILKAALAYSLPLVPHGLAGWVLDLSDRTILQRFVPLGELGLYSLGYQLGTVMTIIASAINNAWVPYVFKSDSAQGEVARSNLSRLTTYYVAFLCWIALGLSLFSKEALAVLTAPAFHSADRVVPWVVGGLLFNGLYFVPVNFLFVKGTTWLIPLITAFSGLLNIALNLWLIPQYGIMAAAWTTFGSYAVMLIIAWTTAQHVYPIPYEYGRLAKLALASGLVLLVANIVSLDSLVMSAALKAFLLLAFPVILWTLRFFSLAEWSFAVQMIRTRTVLLRVPH